MKKYLIPVAAFLLMALLSAACFVACDRQDTTADTTTDTTVDTTTDVTDASTEAPTEPITEPEEETTMEETTIPETTAAPETEPLEAGLDAGVVRDGTPKKYFTIRFDDGITQDAEVMNILKKYNADCCTFYINTGLLGANWAWVGQQFGRPDVPHRRYTRAELMSGVYNGFDVEVHTLTHPSLKNVSDRQVTREVGKDATNITDITGYRPVGMAWPGGDTEWNEQNIKTILETTNIRYGSCTTRNTQMGFSKFALPAYFMTWYPTCSFSDADSLTLLQEFIQTECTEDMLFFVWCHGYELDLFDTWEKFDLFIKTITEAAAEDDSIVLVTNAEFYQLFKDEIPAWKE